MAPEYSFSTGFSGPKIALPIVLVICSATRSSLEKYSQLFTMSLHRVTRTAKISSTVPFDNHSSGEIGCLPDLEHWFIGKFLFAVKKKLWLPSGLVGNWLRPRPQFSVLFLNALLIRMPSFQAFISGTQRISPGSIFPYRWICRAAGQRGSFIPRL